MYRKFCTEVQRKHFSVLRFYSFWKAIIRIVLSLSSLSGFSGMYGSGVPRWIRFHDPMDSSLLASVAHSSILSSQSSVRWVNIKIPLAFIVRQTSGKRMSNL